MSDDLVKRLRERAKIASEEGNMTAKCDAGYFEKSADRIEELEAKLAKAVDGLREIDDKVSWEINPSNYSHDQVCTMNDDWCEVGSIARTTLAELTGGKDE